MAAATTQKSSTTNDAKASAQGQGEGGASTAGPSREAAEHVTHESVSLPLIGRLPMSRDQVGFYAGLGALAALEVVEWPVAVAVAAGHWLMRRSQSGTLREFGQALDEA